MAIDMIRERADRDLKQRGEPGVTDMEWEHVLGREWMSNQGFLGLEGTEEGLAEAADDVVTHILEWRSLPPREIRAVRPAPPSWWTAESEARLRRYEKVRVSVLATFGLMDGDEPHFLKIGEVAGFVSAIRSAESATGDWLTLHVPTELTPLDDDNGDHFLDSEAVVVWRGSSRADLRDGGYLREPTIAERAQEQRLSRLVEVSESIASRIGCRPAEAVAYLLCDYHPRTPWVQASYSREHGGYLIVVRDVRVRPEDVAQAYRYRRDALGLRTRAPQAGPLAVVKHVDAAMQRADFSWSRAYESFCEKYGERYKNLHTFKNTYSRKSRELRGL